MNLDHSLDFNNSDERDEYHRLQENISTDTDTTDESIDNSDNKNIDIDFSWSESNTENVYQSINDNRVMFQDSKMTVHEINVILTALSTKYHLPDVARNEFGTFIKVLGPYNFNHQSLFNNYYMSTRFSVPYGIVKYHFYCKFCNENILYTTKKDVFPKISKECPGCEQKQILSYKNAPYFTSIDIKYQFKQLLKSKKLRTALFCNYQNRKRKDKNDSSISSVTDSDLYRRLPLDENYCTVSVNANTDGAPIFNNSQTSMWPVQLRLNELSPMDNANNVILCGFLLVDCEPSAKLLNLYLKTVLVENIKKLSSTGVTYNDEGNKIRFKMFLLLVTVDSKARPIIQYRMQFNAYYGCSWCYARGEYTNTIRYTFQFSDSKIRTEVSHIEDLHKVTNYNLKHCNGVKGPCALMELPHFDPVWGFPIDILHCICLGVTKQFWDNWTESNSPFYINNHKRKLVNQKLLNFQLPSEIHRDCRPFAPRIKKKGSEWLSWLLFFSIICLQNILPDEALHHFSILVKCVYTLSKKTITEEECLYCHKELLTFVGQCELFYGKNFMTFNLHSLLHLAYNVKKSGPLLATSTFPAESFMFQLQQSKTSSKGVDKQIIRRFLQMNSLKWNEFPRLTPNKISTKFMESILYNKPFYTDENEDIVLSSSEYHDGIHKYNRCIYFGNTYTSKNYCVGLKKNDSVVQLKSKIFVQILYFFKIDNIIYFKAKIISTNVALLNMPHIWKVQNILNESIVESITSIERKCIFLHVNANEQYISVMPNTFDVQ